MKKELSKQLNRIKSKILEKTGETIVETLVSMLIVVLAFMMLAGAIVAAARVNAGTENHTMFVNETYTSGITADPGGKTVTITLPSGTLDTGKTVTTYKDKDSSGILYYYE